MLTKIKKEYTKKLVKEIKIFLKKKKKQCSNIAVDVTKVSQKIKNKRLLSIERNMIEWKKNVSL